MANQVNILVGESIDFTDNSLENPFSWTWTFEGGTPETSTEQNPMGIEYSSTGLFDVTLEVANDYGSHTLTREEYINVGDVGISEFDQKEFSVYPNPCYGKVFVETLHSTSIEHYCIQK